MSLEQALNDNTKAVLALVAGLAAFAVAGPVAATVAAAAEPTKVTKPKATKTEEPKTQPQEAAPIGPANSGDPEGTKYFLNVKHNSVYRIFPGDPHATIKEAKEITGADFLAHQAAQQAAASATKAVATTPSAASAQTAASSGPEVNLFDETPAVEVKVITAEVMIAKLREVLVAPGKGNAALLPILKSVGATSVPTIPADKYAAVYDAAVAALKA